MRQRGSLLSWSDILLDTVTTLNGVGRFWRTVRHLRPVQVTGRVWFRFYRPRPNVAAPPPPLAAPTGTWVAAARRSPSLVGSTTFRFLNEEGSLPEIGWDSPARPKLWRYNQHYFDDLNAEKAEARADWHRALILDWVAANPPGTGTGWEPYPTSLRIVNWIKWALAGKELPPEAIASLAIQARWLTKRLEWHLLGNHLFANAKALLFAGLWFDGPEAAHWRKRALSILAREVCEQILPDGGQFELSPMYHALAVEDVLDLINLVQARGRPDDMDLSSAATGWRERLRPMLNWLDIVSHPDGRIAFFNDSAFGIAADNSELTAYADRLGLSASYTPKAGALRLPNSGYTRLATDEAVLIADLASIGPDYLPGHAHADTLSFELSLGTQRVIVNSGTSIYGSGAERLRQRGTAAHSTVTLKGHDSSEVWSGFRVGRRACVFDARLGEEANVLWAEGAHDGYAHLVGRPVHRRRWELGSTGLRIDDSLAGAKTEARYYLHPSVVALQDESHTGCLLLPNGRRLRWVAKGGAAYIARSSWHPEFGLALPASCLVVPLRDGQATFSLNWA